MLPRLSYYTDLVLYKVYADLKAEHEGNYLGWFWWVFEPVVQMAIYYVVFGIFMASKIENFVEFLLVGLVMWRWFSISITNGTRSIAQHKQLLTQTHMPKLLFPLMSLVTDTARFVIVYLLLVAFLLITGRGITTAWLMLPVVLAVQWVFTFGCTTICAGVMPFFPDIRQIVENLLRAAFFLSGIFFSVASLPLYLQKYLYLNPIAILLDVQRTILVGGYMSNLKGLTYALVVGMVLSALGILFIRRNEYVYAKVA